jgi:hypothetical protein
MPPDPKSAPDVLPRAGEVSITVGFVATGTVVVPSAMWPARPVVRELEPLEMRLTSAQWGWPPTPASVLRVRSLLNNHS